MASAVEICNLALNRLGAESIRAFDEDNKRARACKNIYEHHRDLLLEDHEWAFNTQYEALAQLSGITHPTFSYVYAVPSDCLYARAILDASGRISSRIKWELFSNKIACMVQDAVLRYSILVTNTAQFPVYFVEALASLIAAELAPIIVQDKGRYDSLLNIATARLARARDKDAELGVEYIHRDEDPDNDTFVNPPGSTIDISETPVV